jgi:hypothetical protein
MRGRDGIMRLHQMCAGKLILPILGCFSKDEL